MEKIRTQAKLLESLSADIRRTDKQQGQSCSWLAREAYYYYVDC